MKKTRNILMALFAGFLLTAALLYICGEFLQRDMTLWADATRGQQFVGSTVMILLTIGLLPLSLRLFKFQFVADRLVQRKAPALACWGSVRLVIMGLLLVLNTFFYYAFGFESTYGYLAVVTLLCMPFVFPTMNRCMAEVTPPKKLEDDSVEEQPVEQNV